MIQSQIIVNKARSMLLLLMGLLITACTINEPAIDERLKLQINTVIQNQTTGRQALEELSKVGFTCHEGTAIEPNKKGQYECTISKNGLMYSCIHRVWFDAASLDKQISNIEIHQPMCTGL
jgi:hypothetical protein